MSNTLDTIFIAQRQALTGSVLRLVRDRQVATDLTQETYLRAHKAAQQQEIIQIEAFLFRTARNLALDHLRRSRLRQTAAPSDPEADSVAHIASCAPTAETVLIDRENLRQLTEALRQLPERVRTVVRLSRIEEWPNKRIAAALDVSERTVLNDLKLAMMHCRDVMARRGRT